MLNETMLYKAAYISPKQRIRRISIHDLKGIPITPPPFRDRPSTEGALLLEMETNDGVVGWATSGYTHPIAIELIEKYLAPRIIDEGIDPFRTDLIPRLFDRHTWERPLGRVLVSAMAMVDIACWDIKGKTIGRPVHHLIGGARDRVPVYITHGAAYDGAPVYTADELAAEAAYLVSLGYNHLKNTVGRQAIPDPDDDYVRMAAMREAVGPNVKLSMDGNLRMSLPEAIRLCKLCEELDISFIEEPVYYNDPRNLAHLRQQTTIRVAAAENEHFKARDYLEADSIDYLQPNINNDGGLTASLRIAAQAHAYNIPLSHGNGNGPHNIALHAGLLNGGLVEYHFHKWMTYNALFEEVPQPQAGWLEVSQNPGFGLEPKDGVIREYKRNQ
ncbi:mandelate racemase/muconate lactonizing enzyme family protein [Ochrobactrum sp. EDr1-4]|uniref:mandelate racemase/muconate lactonizing enzyme family protein n=1 Tax=Ochrobactrum sp. EDr1-4 TaxID=3368622 RepID=UPI003B9FC973